MKTFSPEKYISIPQLAQKLGISRIAVFKKVKKGIIPAVKIGRNYVVDQSALTHQDIDHKELTSISLLAQKTGAERKGIYRKVKSGHIHGFKIGRNFIVTKDFIQKKKEEEKYLSIVELAKELRVSRVTIYQKIKQGLIRTVQISEKRKVHKEHVRKNLKNKLIFKRLINRRKR